jgi:Lon protease-like protein
MVETIARPRDLPASIRVFPLSGAVLFPRAVLPLNIFEPRYLAMTRDAMATDRLIGIVQPREVDGRDPPPLFEVGSVGRITRFSETGDGRFLIALTGLVRFRVAAELPVTTPYRQVTPDWTPYLSDWDPPAPLPEGARGRVEAALRAYLQAQDLSADWEAVANADDESLVHTLATVCPFDMLERQALLEAPDLSTRADTLATLMTFAGGPIPPPGTLQ